MSLPAAPAETGEPYPSSEPLRYSQLLRTPAFAWWRPLVGAVVLLVAVFAFASLVLLPVLAVAVAVQSALTGADFGTAFSDGLNTRSISPASLLWLNLTLASAIPVSWALVRWLHHLRPRWLASVLPGIRWRYLLLCLPLAVVSLLISLGLSAVLPGEESGTSVDQGLNHFGGQALAFALVIVITTPLQAAGEEYLFRGYLLQAVGSLFRRNSWLATAVPVLITGLAFGIAHGTQNLPLFFDRFAFGAMAAYLAIRTGGLEAGISAHVLTNFFAYGVTLLTGDITSVLATSEASYWLIPVTVVSDGFYLLAAIWLADRIGVRNRTLPTPAAGPIPIGERRT